MDAGSKVVNKLKCRICTKHSDRITRRGICTKHSDRITRRGICTKPRNFSDNGLLGLIV